MDRFKDTAAFRIREVGDMVWDTGERRQRDEAMAQLARLGYRCGVPRRRLGDRFAFFVSGVPHDRRKEVVAVVLRLCPDATLRE